MQNQLKLVNSTYSSQEAKEVLVGLINDKICFLNKQIFSAKERLGSDTQHLEKRQLELKAALNQLTAEMNALDESEVVEIDCTIAITIRERVH